MSALVAFSCPTCGATVYTSPNAEVAHMCKHTKTRPKLTTFVRRNT